MKRARTVEEYVEMVRSAIDDVMDLKDAIAYDEESMGDAMKFVERLEASIRSVYDSMKDGTYAYGREDLDFMQILDEADERLVPFRHNFYRINETHKKGLEPDEEA